MNNRKRLEKFLNGKLPKIVRPQEKTLPFIILIEESKQERGFMEIWNGGLLLNTLREEDVDSFVATIPNVGLILDFGRPITREEIELRQGYK